MQVIRIKELVKKLSISRSTIWRLEKQGEFPQHFKLSARTACWKLSDFDDYLEKRKSALTNK